MKKIFTISILLMCINIFGQSGTWTILKTNFSSLESIYFINDEIGWVVSEPNNYTIVSKTTNGGETWTSVSINNTTTPTDIFFIDNYTGWICGQSNMIVKTTDGGLTWTHINPNNIAQADWHTIDFPTTQVGYVVGNGLSPYKIIEKSTDGGLSWNNVSGNLYQNQILWDCHFINKDTGIVVGANGLILSTYNGVDITTTQPWAHAHSWYPGGPDFFSISRADSNCFIVSSRQNATGYTSILKTTDFGGTWEKINVSDNNGYGFISTSFASNFGLGINTQGNIYVSYNSGDGWKRDTSFNVTTNEGANQRVPTVFVTRS